MNKTILKNKNIVYYKNNLAGFKDIPNTHQKLIYKLIDTFFSDEKYIVRCKYLDINNLFDIKSINLNYLPEEIIFENLNINQQISIPIVDDFNDFFKDINHFIKIYKLIDNNTLSTKNRTDRNNLNLLDLE